MPLSPAMVGSRESDCVTSRSATPSTPAVPVARLFWGPGSTDEELTTAVFVTVVRATASLLTRTTSVKERNCVSDGCTTDSGKAHATTPVAPTGRRLQ